MHNWPGGWMLSQDRRVVPEIVEVQSSAKSFRFGHGANLTTCSVARKRNGFAQSLMISFVLMMRLMMRQILISVTQPSSLNATHAFAICP